MYLKQFVEVVGYNSTPEFAHYTLRLFLRTTTSKCIKLKYIEILTADAGILTIGRYY